MKEKFIHNRTNFSMIPPIIHIQLTLYTLSILDVQNTYNSATVGNYLLFDSLSTPKLQDVFT